MQISDDVTKHINTIRYWNFGKKTFKEFLQETNRTDVWEDKHDKLHPSRHPNSLGYQLISEEIFNYCKSQDILP